MPNQELVGRATRVKRGCALAATLIVGSAASGSPTFAQGATMRVSVHSSGIQAVSGSDLGEWAPGYRLASPVSFDGRCIAIISGEAFDANDTNLVGDAYVHDRATGATTRVSVSSSGIQANDHTFTATLSGDGRCVAFESRATNLVAGDTNAAGDVFVHDRQTALTTRVSVDSFGVQAIADTGNVCISGDGRCVGFESYDSNLTPGDTNGWSDIFVHDRQTGQTSRASVGLGGVEPNFNSSLPSISADGRYVAFTSRATNLVAGDTNGYWDIFVHDRQAGTTALASVDSAGAQANGTTWDGSISANGLCVAFGTHATNLVPADLNMADDVFVRDLQAGTTTRVSVNSGGVAGSGHSHWATISNDGRFVSFRSSASNLVASDTNNTWDVFVHDRLTGQTERVSLKASGQQPRFASGSSAVSGDGRVVAFTGYDELVAGDTNGWGDVYVRDRSIQCAPIVSYCTAKENSLGCVPAIGASGWPSATGYDAFFVTASEVLNHSRGLLFWSSGPSATPLFGGTLCVAAPRVRTATQDSNGSSAASDCSGAYSFHFNQAYAQGLGLSPGATVFAQWWSRDQGFAPPHAVGLTDALSFTICN